MSRKVVKLTRTQLKQIIKEELDILSERSGAQLVESNVKANLKKKPEDLSDDELKEIYDELIWARGERHDGRMPQATLDEYEKKYGPFEDELKKREKEKKEEKEKEQMDKKVPFADYYRDQMYTKY